MAGILIILGSYLPKPSPNGICVHRVVSELRKKGALVTVVADQSGELSSLDVVDGVEVHRVRARWFDRALHYCKAADTPLRRIAEKTVRFLRKAQLAAFAPLWPLETPIHAYRLFSKARALHERNRYDLVIAVHCPIDSLIAGCLLKARYSDVKLVLYFLDALSGGVTPSYLSRDWARRMGRFWELRFFRRADAILIMESHESHYRGDDYRPFFDKLNVVGVPLLGKVRVEDRQYGPKFDSDAINLVYTGSLLRRVKNPEYALAVFQRLSERMNCVFHVYGGGDCTDIMARYRRDSGGSVVVHGQVDIAEAHNALMSADLLVNIGSLVETQIPGKIFEYMSTGKPIISFYKDDMEPSIPYLKKYGLALLVQENWDDLENTCTRVTDFIASSLGKRMEYGLVSDLFRSNRPEITADIIMRYSG